MWPEDYIELTMLSWQQHHDFSTFYSWSTILFHFYYSLFPVISPVLPLVFLSRRVTKIYRLIPGILSYFLLNRSTLAVVPRQQKLCNFNLFQWALLQIARCFILHHHWTDQLKTINLIQIHGLGNIMWLSVRKVVLTYKEMANYWIICLWKL